MEEMKNSTEALLEKTHKDVVGESTENPALIEFIIFSRRYPKRIESKLRKDLDMVKYTLEDYGINYHMNLVVCSIALFTSRIKDADLIEKARVLVRLLALDVPASQAITILNGRNWEVMMLGYQKDRLCSQDGTNEFLEYCINSTQKFYAGVDRSMEEMKILTEAVEEKRNDVVCESTQYFGLSLMNEDEDDVNFELVTLTRGYHKFTEPWLQKYLPMVKSKLEGYGILYQMKPEICAITLSTKRSRDADLIEKAKDILRLLTLAVVAPVAVTILNGRNWELVMLGYDEDGLCSQFGINEEKFYERLKLLHDHATMKIAAMLFCDIQIFGDILVLVGSASSIKLMRTLAKEIMVHGIHPASRVKSFKNDAEALHQTTKRLEGLDLNDYSLASDRSKRVIIIKWPLRSQQK